MKNVAVRQSCFAFISAIESDLRKLICDFFPDSSADEIMPSDVKKNSEERYRKCNGEDYRQPSSDEDSLNKLIDFIDFNDISKILRKSISSIATIDETTLIDICNKLESLTGSRNRVCHSRPLESDDFQNLYDFSQFIIKSASSSWSETKTALRKISDPEYIFSFEIPDYWKSDADTVLHNLPIPEFDDTGFLGRRKNRSDLKKLILSNTSVISIVGEGGVGKTAIAQRCLYDTIEHCELLGEQRPFDIVVWVSLKANRLTTSGINQIFSAIDSSIGLYSEVTQFLNGSAQSNRPIRELLEEINEYMREFNVLMCIDNLETISGEDVREFLANIPNGSKVLITSRIGLGEIEYRYKLDNLEDADCISLFRKLSSLLNIQELKAKNNKSIIGICTSLFKNPLLIKWYIFSLASGKSSGELINRSSKNFKEAVRFCFENLYDLLSKTEVELIRTIACARKPTSEVEIRYFIEGIPDAEIQEALHVLYNSSMLNISTDEGNVRIYSLTNIAEEYLSSFRPIEKPFYEKIKMKRKELQQIIENENIKNEHYYLDLSVIDSKTRNERICASYLRKAFEAFYKKDVDQQESLITKAKELMPEYSETYRVNAFFLKDTFPVQAAKEFERAIEYDPLSAKALYAYSQFLFHEGELNDALAGIDKALLILAGDRALTTFKARVLMILGRYSCAESIFDELSQDMSDVKHRKFRISTYDQAIECQQRKIDQLINDEDYPSVERSTMKVLTIIDSAIENGDIDKELSNKIPRILRQIGAASVRSHSDIAEIYAFLTSWLAKNIDRLPVTSLRAIRDQTKTNTSRDPACGDLLSPINSILDSILSSPSEQRERGRITRVVDSGRGVSYGFIDSTNESEYFFHRSELNPSNYLDSIDERSIWVTFLGSRNDKGLCALDIHPEKEEDPRAEK